MAAKTLTMMVQATIMMSLLQPAPEVYDVFDDVLLLCEGELL